MACHKVPLRLQPATFPAVSRLFESEDLGEAGAFFDHSHPPVQVDAEAAGQEPLGVQVHTDVDEAVVAPAFGAVDVVDGRCVGHGEIVGCRSVSHSRPS